MDLVNPSLGGGSGSQTSDTDWLHEVLEETGLQQFHSKLTNDLQLTKLSHFDFVSEQDLVQLGLSRPASRRLLASIKKRKSFVTALKNRIVNKLIPTSTSLSFSQTTPKSREILSINSGSDISTHHTQTYTQNNHQPNSEFGRLTCLINAQDIQIKEEIGHGVHGFVKKGKWTTPNGRIIDVALKILKKDVMSEPGASFRDFVKEISVMHKLDHPHIIKLYGVVLSSPMMMVTELAPFGNLRDKLRKENGCTPISLLINFGVQITTGMAYLQSMRFVHRDLAARNIFITDRKRILIGDFGLMRAVPSEEDHYVMSEKTKIPYPWCAPESLKRKQFSSSSDVYMFGVTMWEMFSFGEEPWAGLNLNEILTNISSEKTRLPQPEACPSMIYQTMLQCWNTCPEKRPSFSILHQYLSTSYALEVIATKSISECGQKRSFSGNLVPNDLSDSFPSLTKTQNEIDNRQSHAQQLASQPRKVLNCTPNDHILVIDGQPEKYWWKGQNQRTFEIGWFPLSSTRWHTNQNLDTHLISKPLKDSFVHTGHCGADGKWGSPGFIDKMYLRNPLQPDDINSINSWVVHPGKKRNPTPHKDKSTRSRLSRLFGINDSTGSTATTPLLTRSYQKFNNEAATKASPKLKPFDLFSDSPKSVIRSQSDELVAPIEGTKPDDEPPLIDFSEDCPTVNSMTGAPKGNIAFSGATADGIFKSTPANKQESLLDMDNNFLVNCQFPDIPPQRHASESRLDQMDEADNYHSSWAGSWNTGTFDGSNGNLYSAYYCPQDAASVSAVNATSTAATFSGDVVLDTNRYYSTVTQEHNE